MNMHETGHHTKTSINTHTYMYHRRKTAGSYCEVSTCGTWRDWRCWLHGVAYAFSLLRPEGDWLPHLQSLELFSKVPCTCMFRTMWVFLNHEMNEKQETAGCHGYSGCVLPARPYPKCVTNAKGILDGPLRWPCRNMQLKTSAARRMSTGPETLKPQSATCRRSQVKCFHQGLKATGNAGKRSVILGSTTASTLQSWWGYLPSP